MGKVQVFFGRVCPSLLGKIMRLFATQLTKDDAQTLVNELLSIGITAELHSSTKYSKVFVSEPNFEEAQEYLSSGACEVQNISEAHLLAIDSEFESIVECPTCKSRKVEHPPERLLWVILLASLPVFCIPGLIYGILIYRRGPLKRCLICQSIWRRKP